MTDGQYKDSSSYQYGYMYPKGISSIKGYMAYISNTLTNRFKGPSSPNSSYPLHMKTERVPISEML
jgi:hypothetical protein